VTARSETSSIKPIRCATWRQAWSSAPARRRGERPFASRRLPGRRRRQTLEAIDFASIQSSGYVFQVEMAVVTERLGFRAFEVPIYFEDRRIGRSKMSVRIKLEAALRVWQIRWRHRNLKR
jgi:hypothetical protein